jgi:hypothetical protein
VHVRFLIWLIALSSLTWPSSKCLAQDTDQKPKIHSELSGKFGLDFRYFPQEPLYLGQHGSYISVLFQPEFYMEWDKGRQLIQFTGFGRLDQYDVVRSHADIRELYWQIILKKWEISVGVKKIFWGVTESNHPVDIINQADALEGFDLEQKLGQPMVHVSWLSNWGTFDFYAMTFFREMQFPGYQGRLRPPFLINYDNTIYESPYKRYNLDLALRWSHSFSIFDLGISNFYGTSRLPLFAQTDGILFSPIYELMNQTGLDVQALTGPMIWKTEMIYRISRRKTIFGFTAGGEYTFGNIFHSGMDIGLIAEYNYDDRGIELINSLDDDFFFGTRLAFNDPQSSDFLGGIIIDRNNQTLRYFLEANRRLGESWKINVEVSGFENIPPTEFLYLVRNDSYIQFSLINFF